MAQKAVKVIIDDQTFFSRAEAIRYVRKTLHWIDEADKYVDRLIMNQSGQNFRHKAYHRYTWRYGISLKKPPTV